MSTQDQANQDKAKVWAELDRESEGDAQAAIDEITGGNAGGATTQASSDAHDVETNPKTDTSAADQAALNGGGGGGDDPYGSLPTTVRDELLGLKSMVGGLTQRLRNAEGHIGGLNSKLQQQVEAARTLSASGGAAPTAREIREAQGDRKATQELYSEYPEFAEALKAALDEQIGGLKSRIDTMQPTQTGVSRAELDAMRAELTVEARHPGWQDIVQTPEFRGWFERQPYETQMLAASDSPQASIRLLDLHQSGRNSAAQDRTRRLDSAAAIPTGRSGSGARAKPIDQMSKAELWSYLDAEERGRR